MKVASLMKLAYGGDTGDGSYYDRTYLPVPDPEELDDPEVFKSYDMKDTPEGWITVIDTWLPGYQKWVKGFAKTPDTSIKLSRHSYNINDKGELDEIPLSEWLTRYALAKRNKDLNSLRELGSYSFFRYEELKKKIFGLF